ncbi:hypothetical protein [Streptomyces sp. NPDC050564]|uniref:hypothetical protein n=1 Tax=Streptomyces sp. NPDC050564 TaxID=3365631 RepID=UPI0037B87061
MVTELVGVGMSHVVLSLPAPCPTGVAHQLVDEIIEPVVGRRPDTGAARPHLTA